MSNNNWNQPPNGGGMPGDNQVPPRTGKLLRDFAQQSPAGPDYSQMPPAQYPPRVPGMPPAGQPSPTQNGGPVGGMNSQSPNWMESARQTMQRFSGKMRAYPQQSNQPPAGWPTANYQQPYNQPQYNQQQQFNQNQPYTPTAGQMVPYGQISPLPPVADSQSQRWRRSRSTRISMLKRRRRVRWGQAHPRAQRVTVSIVVSLLILLIIGFSSGGASAYNFYQAQLPRLHDLSNQIIPQTSYIYDRNGTLLYETPSYDTTNNGSKSLSFGGRRILVSYSQIPDVLKNAQIAIEDHTFWTNSGVDPQGILRAASSGGSAGGGSTLTQQVIKNLSHDDAHSINRKMTEAALAIALTQQYPKTKILEMYFNVAGYGAQELGAEAAIEDYFGLKPTCKSIGKCVPAMTQLDYNPKTKKHDPLLALARASLLAGMPQNPNSYDPTLGADNKARALERQKQVLNAMMMYNEPAPGLGAVTPEIIQQVHDLTSKMKFSPHQVVSKYPHFVQWVLDTIENTLGNGDTSLGAQILNTGGFRIRTTLDAHIQDYVQNSVKTNIEAIDPAKNVHNAAAVVMNAKTGEILAMDGSVDYNSKDPQVGGQINMAVTPRQPGSSFKPLVYATSMQMGMYPGTVLSDFKTYFPNGGVTNVDHAYHPVDYGGANGMYHDLPTSIRFATANSLNVPAVKAISYTGVGNVTTMVNRMGIHVAARDQQLSMVLGTAAVPLLTMTGAYQIFANQGKRVLPQGILDIWDNYGRQLYHYDATHPIGVQVLSPQIAFMTSSILTDEEDRALDFGSIHTLSMWDQFGQRDVVAAKTGTTDSFKDNWTIGYTPDVVVGVWAGNTDDSVMQNVIGITGAAPIWHDVMECVTGVACAEPAEPFTRFPRPTIFAPPPSERGLVPDFTAPPGVELAQVSAATGLLGTGQMDWILTSDIPQQAGGPPIQVGSSPTPTPQNGQGGGTPSGRHHHGG